MNYVLLVNSGLGAKKFEPSFLDNYIEKSFETNHFLLHATNEDAYMKAVHKDQTSENQFYGANEAYSKSTNARDWLKFQSCLTKEPSYTSYVGIRGCVDYIFYEGEGIMEVVRTLDLPSYSRFLKNNVQAIPHELMPSDHFSIMAEFLLL